MKGLLIRRDGRFGPNAVTVKTCSVVAQSRRLCETREESMMEFEEEISDLQRLRELMPFDASSGSALKVSGRRTAL